jgi:hypothetical protein
MYAALWRVLPGGRLAKVLEALALAALVVALLFLVVFPAVVPHLPFEDVTVEGAARAILRGAAGGW